MKANPEASAQWKEIMTELMQDLQYMDEGLKG